MPSAPATTAAAARPSISPKETADVQTTSAHYGKTPEPETPYQNAAQVWDERIGSARVQAKNWRLMAFGSLILSAGFALGLVWQSARGTVVPWVVQVDQPRPGAGGRAGDMQTISRPIRRSPFTSRASSSRSAGSPPIRSSCARTGCAPTTSPPIAAPPRSTTIARANDPFANVGKQQIAVEVSSVIRASPDSFRVAWTERAYENGQLAATERWTAILTVVIQPPRDADRLRKNPLGVYVNAINWSKELGQ